MAKSKEELQQQLATFKHELKDYEAKLKKAVKDGDKRKQVDYAMAVAGLKNSIREIGTQLRKM